MIRFAKLLLLALTLCAIFIAGMVYEQFYGLARSNLSADNSNSAMPLPNLENAEVHVFLLAGQSNMDGRGEIAGYSPPPQHLADRIFVFGKDYTLTAGREPVSNGGVGPSIAFAATYLEQIDEPDVSVVLVPIAKGATNIDQWGPSSVDGALYTEAVKRTLAASHLGKVRGILFFQGESDALRDSDDPSQSWGLLFKQMVTEFRSDLNTPALPIVFAQLGAGDDPNWERIKAAQKNVDLDNSVMITTDDLPYGQDVHFTTSSYVEIGRRFAMAMIELQ